LRTLSITRRGRFSRQECQWLLAAAALLPAVSVMLRLRGLGSCLALCRRLVVTQQDRATSAQAYGDVAAIGRMVRLAAVYGPYRASCLPRSVVLWVLLRHRGLSPDIRIGVRKPGLRFEAHAWVELEGRPLEADSGTEPPFAALRSAFRLAEETTR
jgi:hypothetical protein